ncbi:hypothetical protein GWI33_011142 [Rhynchophorus ferrugineus]|uniref:Uncharacterized protein n=1 Tax=Rhynchophorus ferrugineus TaxID=354439 RepID=A0A834ID76_RHYFE|nr:hypothetical protein GWI33_011141 [Rhynchophorus ferrugineus]KAF7275920.1 hypothetical protein GWI33_011142 [Rhynchophorus ferrugineus]
MVSAKSTGRIRDNGQPKSSLRTDANPKPQVYVFAQLQIHRVDKAGDSVVLKGHVRFVGERSVGVIILAGSALSYVGVMVSFMYKSRIGTYITMPLYGFFVAPVLIVGFEYLVEITYPMPETCSSSAFNAAYNFLSVITTYALEEMWNTVGHLYTFIVIIVILAICAVVMAFVKTDLKRRGANLQDSRTDKEIEAERQSHRYSVTF